MVRKRKINFVAILVLVFAVVFASLIMSLGSNVTSVYAVATPTASIGSLTISSYETRDDGLVFSQTVLNTLYGYITGNTNDKTYDSAYTKVKGSTSTLYGKSDSTSLVDTQNNSMNISQINGGNPITVEFGGYTWNVIYLTTRTNGCTDGTGDLVATLWMSDTDVAKGNVKWNEYITTTTNVNEYSPVNYGTSMIRMKTLNAGSKDYVDTTYATAKDALNGTVTKETRASDDYARFTMSNDALEQAGVNSAGNMSLIDYIATPSQVLYQEKENYIWCNQENTVYLGLNDAWGTANAINGKTWNSSANTQRITQQARYFDWASDYLWLPSLVEMGFGLNGGSMTAGSLWGIPKTDHNIHKASLNYWSRSGHHTNLNKVHYIGSNAVGNNTEVNSTNYSIRPALHLNLTAAQTNASLKTPVDVTKTYSGTEQGIEDQTWFKSMKNDVTVEYYKGNTQLPANQKPKLAADDYSVKLTIKSTSDRFWADGTTAAKTIAFKINKKEVDFPKLVTANKPYSGNTPPKFYFSNLDDILYQDSTKTIYLLDIVDIKKSSSSPDASYDDSGDPYVTAPYAGTYTMDVSLTDNNYKWKNENNTLTFTVDKADINVTIHDGKSPQGYAFTGAENSTISAWLEVERGCIHTGKTVTVNVVAYRSGATRGTVVAKDLVLTDATDTVAITLDLSSLSHEYSYTLGVEVVSKDSDNNDLGDGKNYSAVMTHTPTLIVTDASLRNSVTWRLTSNGQLVGNQVVYSELDEKTKTFDGSPIVYNGKEYGFSISVPNGYTRDTGYGGADGYLITYLNSDNQNVCIDADTYTISIKIKQDGTSGDGEVYSLTWTIEKAKFDLSKVKWTDDGKMEYDDGNLIVQTIDSKTLQPGLLVDNYAGVKDGFDVGDGGQISVTFKLADGYADNYELPVRGGKGTNYIFTGDGDFEWDKEWEVTPAVIKLEWEEKEITDDDGNVFSVLVLKDPRADGKVDYAYYQTKNNGEVLDPDALPVVAEDIEYSATDRKYFKAFPTIRRGYDVNYVFPNNNTAEYSSVFAVGGGASSVKVELANDKYEYKHNKPVKLKVNIIGAATENQLAYTYYVGVVDDDHKVDGVPTDAGNYIVVISSNTNTVVLSGTTQYEFEITKSVVSTSWKTAAKPPVLDLKYGQINGIHYEIFDSAGNPVAQISDIVAGNYKIRATITDTQNYIFDDDTTVTELVDFTVSTNDVVLDPNDPSNPHYPQTDPDEGIEGPPTPGPEDGDDGNAFVKFFKDLIEKKFPLWQVIVMGVSGILTLIFLIKAIQYGNRAKKAKGGAKKAGVKAAAAFLPVFDATVVYGLSNKIWSIMAFALVGVALVMFVIALVMRKSWKKAEAVAGVGGAENQQQSNELKELKDQIALMNSKQSAGGSADSIAIIEAMRREMDERRREDEERHRREMEEREARYREEQARRDEEQAKRDETMKMMLAGFMGSRAQDDNGNMIYGSLDDTDLLVQRVIAGLLPAVQQMIPEPTAYLTAPNEQNEELLHIVEEQNAQMQAMTEQMNELQAQLASMHEIADAVIMPDSNDEILAQMKEMQQQIASLGNQQVATTVVADNSDLVAQMNAMQKQLAELGKGGKTTVVNSDNSDLLDEMSAMRKQIAMLAQSQYDMSVLDDEDGDLFDDDEEEWDSILDEDEEDNFVESVIIEADGTVRKVSPNFRMRLKQSSDKNREWYTVVKNMFCSQKGVTYRVCKRVEKIRYQGQVIGVIGIAKRSIKLWLALKPYEYDARRYHHKDVSDKPRFVDVPMYLRISSDRALERAQELILALFQEFNMEERKRYNDRGIQELIFTLKHNKLLTNKYNKTLLRETVHVHDCDVLDDETAQKCIEIKNVDVIDDSVIETVKLDDIDAHFLDGNRVTLEKLKRAGLVSEECTGVNIIADKRLTKPLIVVANDFTLSAVKMIVLTGGRAIKLTQI